MKDACGQVFRFGIGEGTCTRNPSTDLRDQLPAATRKHFSAITQPEQVGELLRENTVRAALRALGYRNEDMTAHGFRAMARTMAAERLDVQPEVIEAQLATRYRTRWGGPTTARSTWTSGAR